MSNFVLCSAFVTPENQTMYIYLSQDGQKHFTISTTTPPQCTHESSGKVFFIGDKTVAKSNMFEPLIIEKSDLLAEIVINGSAQKRVEILPDEKILLFDMHQNKRTIDIYYSDCDFKCNSVGFVQLRRLFDLDLVKNSPNFDCSENYFDFHGYDHFQGSHNNGTTAIFTRMENLSDSLENLYFISVLNFSLS